MIEKMPLISIITTVYNTEKYVERCFDSVMNQTYPNLEFIVVDNGSEGNIEEIVSSYKVAYPNKKINLVRLRENIGLFHGRLAGLDAAGGEYIAFIDSDDRVSLDYYRMLFRKLEKSNADMVASDVVLEFSSDEMIYENLNPFHYTEVDLSGEDILNHFWGQEGSCYYWHLVWNKLYSRKLVDQAKPILKRLQDQVIMCDDLAYSSVFFALSQHFVSTNLCQYYYYKRDDAYTGSVPSPKRYKDNIANINSVFSFLEIVQESFGLKRYENNLKNWKDRMFRTWCRNIKDSRLRNSEKKALIQYLLNSMNQVKPEYPDKADDYYYQCQTTYIPFSDYIVKDFLEDDVKYVSFDIFDTLLIRPFAKPADLFTLLNSEFQKERQGVLSSDFCTMRVTAERYAREKMHLLSLHEEVTLEEIYSELQELYDLPHNICKNMMNLEIQYELQYCKARKYGYELYLLALDMGKRVVCTSDMYLTKDIITLLLRNNGFTEIDDIFVSSEKRRTKHNGTLYKVVLHELGISPKNILHIGDNEYSDIQVPQKLGIHTVHLPKTMDVWSNSIPSKLSGTFFSRCYHDNTVLNAQGSFQFIGSSCVQAVVANELFDNPFRNHNENSDFNANIYETGFALLGPYLLGLSRWLYEGVEKNNYECIHFIARDGYLLKEAFDILQPFLGDKIFQTNYFYTSRKAMIPLMIRKKSDLESLDLVINYKNYSPRKILELLRPLLNAQQYKCAKEICAKENIEFELPFNDYLAYIRFLKIIKTKFFSLEETTEYRSSMRNYFVDIVGEKDCFFDIGYSGRTESILKNLTGRSIDTYYLHVNQQISYDNASQNRFNIYSFFDYSPHLPGPVREFLLSAVHPSCIGYHIDNNKVTPIFSNEDSTFLQRHIILELQRGAIDFVKKMVDCFGSKLKEMPMRNHDLTWPMEYYLVHAQRFDLSVFSGVDFEDSLFLGKKVHASDYWDEYVQRNQIGLVPYYDYIPRWKKVIILGLLDRYTLKKKIRKRLKNHPRVLKVMSNCYSIPRGVYHLFKRSGRA